MSDNNNFPNINSEQADNIVELAIDMFGEKTLNLIDKHGVNINHMVRFMYLSKLCQKTREEKGISIKDASSKLNIPQYELIYIEQSGIGDVGIAILEKYIKYLGLEKEFNSWAKQNDDLYKEIGKNKK